MRFVKLDRDTRPEDLVAAVYAAPAAGSGETLVRAAAALRQANPALSSLRTVPKGTIVAVPSVPGLVAGPKAEPAAKGGGDLIDAARQAVKAARDHLRDAVNRDADDFGKSLKLVRSAAFKKLVQDKAPTAAKRVAEAEKTMNDRLKEGEALAKRLPAVLQTLGKDLDDLEKRLQSR